MDYCFYFRSFLTVVWDQSIHCLFCSSKPHHTWTQVSHFTSQVFIKHHKGTGPIFENVFNLICTVVLSLLNVLPNPPVFTPTTFFLFLLLSDLTGVLPKAGVASMDSDLGAIVDGPSAEDLGQSLVFTNSHHNGRTATHSYAHATANTYAHAASAGTTYAHAALVQTATRASTYICLYVTSTWSGMNVFSSCFASLILAVLSSGFWFWVPECT